MSGTGANNKLCSRALPRVPCNALGSLARFAAWCMEDFLKIEDNMPKSSESDSRRKRKRVMEDSDSEDDDSGKDLDEVW